ncbi:hypothetical protein K2Q16_01250 [Patescibacteria group bacterium]|nr:hypothetical protein [Patescibacteria group bacterium]
MSRFTSTLKTFTPIVLLGLVLLSPVAPVQAAATESAQSRAGLLAQIHILTKEVERLKALIAARALVQKPLKVYESRFFDVRFETVYQVTQRGLVRLDAPGAGVRTVDAQIYSLLTGVLGSATILEYIDDFRVFNNDNTELSAFVETKSGGDTWLFGVNRSGFSLTDGETKASFIDLFLHEYAHLLLLKEDDLVSDYEDSFWSTADYRHATRVERAVDQFDVMQAYYESNKDRFVSDYATMNVDEDIAESFVSFVVTNRPVGNRLRDQKINFFYGSRAMVEERTRLRNNLRTQGVILSGS